MKLYRLLLLPLGLFLLESSGAAGYKNWPSLDCGDIIKVDSKSIDKDIVSEIKKRGGLKNSDLSFSKQECNDGYFIFAEAIGKYRNPGRHWLVIFYKDGYFEVIDGM